MSRIIAALCKAIGHKWSRAYDLPYEPEQGRYGTWWREPYRCERCGEVSTMLVASKEG